MKRLFGAAFGSGRKAHTPEQIMQRLSAIAVNPASHPSFTQRNAFVRAYTVALGITVPEHVARAAFPGDAYPPWRGSVCRKDFAIFLDLAAVLAWRQCLGAFNDLGGIFDDEHIEAGRESLMAIAGEVFPVSDRAAILMRRYDRYESDDNATREFFAGTPLADVGTAERPAHLTHLEIHAWMVNETLGEPALYLSPPFDTFKLTDYLANLETAATLYFKERALDLLGKHLDAGLP
ncbi:MAG TPA: hypothetical protein VGG51_05020 [Candidatus Cybelea sp.]|jgi:hypothetical protein